MFKLNGMFKLKWKSDFKTYWLVVVKIHGDWFLRGQILKGCAVFWPMH